MNAYELADKGLNSEGLKHPELWNLCIEISRMLIKQTDRIGVLKANHEIQKNINKKALQYIEHLEQGLRATLDLNNAQATRTTPQTKPLSDEEIQRVIDRFTGVTDENEECITISYADLDSLCRAIEAKVRGEK